METRTRRQMQRRSERRAHRDPRAARPAPEQTTVPQAADIQDHAHYACDCGHGFSARVSTSVDCPRCGADQSW